MFARPLSSREIAGWCVSGEVTRLHRSFSSLPKAWLVSLVSGPAGVHVCLELRHRGPYFSHLEGNKGQRATPPPSFVKVTTSGVCAKPQTKRLCFPSVKDKTALFPLFALMAPVSDGSRI